MSKTDPCLKCGQWGHTSSSCKRLKLFARKPGNAISIEAHARALAHRVLDKAMSGDKKADRHIEWALRVTGDLVGGGGAHAGACPPAFGRRVGA